jgi:hypothetical protein
LIEYSTDYTTHSGTTIVDEEEKERRRLGYVETAHETSWLKRPIFAISLGLKTRLSSSGDCAPRACTTAL